MVRVDDVGVAQKGSKKEDEQPKSELAKYQNKSYIRNNLLFSQFPIEFCALAKRK